MMSATAFACAWAAAATARSAATAVPAQASPAVKGTTHFRAMDRLPNQACPRASRRHPLDPGARDGMHLAWCLKPSKGKSGYWFVTGTGGLGILRHWWRFGLTFLNLKEIPRPACVLFNLSHANLSQRGKDPTNALVFTFPLSPRWGRWRRCFSSGAPSSPAWRPREPPPPSTPSRCAGVMPGRERPRNPKIESCVQELLIRVAKVGNFF